ncbi:MAG: hemerythrin domain-containing protein [Candidatus Rokubacteria bacterium]|nr:hemerythrin domain-containing protein [Candidatus Rokubacteria bacterium]
MVTNEDFEKIFYPALDGIRGAAEGLEEARADHEAVKMFLADALATESTDPALSDRVSELRELVLAHASEEEEELFPLAVALGDDALVRLGREMLARKDERAGQLASRVTAA